MLLVAADADMLSVAISQTACTNTFSFLLMGLNSKMALEEGVALAKALGARVTVVTVTTPFHVLTVSPGMLTDTPERYKEHVTVFASQYLDVAKKIAAAAGVACDVVHIEHEHPHKAILRRDPNGPARTTRDIGHFARQRNPQGAHA